MGFRRPRDRRYALGMTTTARKRYPSDLTDLQWDNIGHPFPQGDGATGRPRTYPRRELVNACLYLARGGGTGRMLPHDFPPRETVSYYFYTWRDTGVQGVRTLVRCDSLQYLE